MDISNAVVELRNPRRGDLEPVEIEALADTGSTHLCIPASIRDALELEGFEERPVVLADGTRRTPLRGPDRFYRCIGHGRSGAAWLGSHGRHGLGSRSENPSGYSEPRQPGPRRLDRAVAPTAQRPVGATLVVARDGPPSASIVGHENAEHSRHAPEGAPRDKPVPYGVTLRRYVRPGLATGRFWSI